MPAILTEDEIEVRRAKILTVARWCFLNFGFSKTTFEDIAKRSHLSRTLLYRVFKDKGEIYQAVFLEWLVSRQLVAKEAAKTSASVYERLTNVSRILAMEPWGEMVSTPMGQDFLGVCKQIAPKNMARYRKASYECFLTILEDKVSAEVFMLALDGLFADQPSVKILEKRIRLLAARFAVG